MYLPFTLQVAAARAFNEAVVDNLTHNGGRDLTFKAPSHMQAYNKHLVRTVSQAHAAGVQAAVEAASDPQQQQQLDLEEVLGTILRECVQHACSFQNPPAGLQALANAVWKEVPAGHNAAAAAAAAGDGADRDVIGAARPDLPPPAAGTAAAATAGNTSAAKAGSHSTSKTAAALAPAAAAAASGAGRGNKQAAAAAGAAAAGGGDVARSMSAASAAAAAAAGGSRLPSGGLGAFAGLRQPPPGGHSSKKSRKVTAAGQGKGKGGEGGSKVCVPCTQLQLSGEGHKLTVSAAKVHPAAVIMDGDHQKPPAKGGCKFCKCSECKKQWGDSEVQPADYTKAVACIHNRHCPNSRHYKGT